MRCADRAMHEFLRISGVDAATIIREILRELGGFNIAQELFGGDFNVDVWSKEAQRIVRAARFEAAVFDNDYIGTEHVLLSLLRDAVNPAALFLASFYEIPITIAGVPSAVTSVTGNGARLLRRKLDLTPNANRLIADSQLAASRTGRNFVGGEHMLAAIVANRSCTAARALAKRVNLDRLENDLTTAFGVQR